MLPNSTFADEIISGIYVKSKKKLHKCIRAQGKSEKTKNKKSEPALNIVEGTSLFRFSIFVFRMCALHDPRFTLHDMHLRTCDRHVLLRGGEHGNEALVPAERADVAGGLQLPRGACAHGDVV